VQHKLIIQLIVTERVTMSHTMLALWSPNSNIVTQNRSMRSMRSMRGGIIFRNRGPSLVTHVTHTRSHTGHPVTHYRSHTSHPVTHTRSHIIGLYADSACKHVPQQVLHKGQILHTTIIQITKPHHLHMYEYNTLYSHTPSTPNSPKSTLSKQPRYITHKIHAQRLDTYII